MVSRFPDSDPLAFLQSLAEIGGDIVPCAIGRRRAFLLNHPGAIEDVLVRHPEKFVKGRGFDRARRLLGSGLLTASGALHASRRRLLQPAFHRQRMADYARAIVAHAASLRDRWEERASLEIASEMQGLTLRIAGETLFGADLEPRIGDVRRAVAAAIARRDGLIAVVAPPHRARCARRQLETIVDEVIERRLQSGVDRDDLLSMLLASGVSADSTADQVRDDAITMLLAGHDTIAHALTWTWTLLAQHANVERQLHRELAEVTAGRPVTAADLPRLVYTKSVLAEALRLFPPAWVIVRRAVEDHQCGGTLLPSGALVIASPFVMHRDPRFFVEPLAFDPARWLAPEITSRPRLAYLPFGAGTRACIGESFAWMEGTLVLATLAQRWRLIRAGDVPIRPSPKITLRPEGPVMMVAHTA